LTPDIFQLGFRQETIDDRTPRYGAPAAQMLQPMFLGVTAPWNFLLSAALGVWLMFAPSVIGTQGRVTDGGDLSARLFSPSP
jgi:hypothetical protein